IEPSREVCARIARHGHHRMSCANRIGLRLAVPGYDADHCDRLLATEAHETEASDKAALAAIELGCLPFAVLRKDRTQALIRRCHCPLADIATRRDLAEDHDRHRGLVS